MKFGVTAGGSSFEIPRSDWFIYIVYEFLLRCYHGLLGMEQEKTRCGILVQDFLIGLKLIFQKFLRNW